MTGFNRADIRLASLARKHHTCQNLLSAGVRSDLTEWTAVDPSTASLVYLTSMLCKQLALLNETSMAIIHLHS